MFKDKDLISLCGGPAAFAEALSVEAGRTVRPNTVSMWRHRGFLPEWALFPAFCILVRSKVDMAGKNLMGVDPARYEKLSTTSRMIHPLTDGLEQSKV